MNHPVAVRAENRKILELGGRLPGFVQRRSVVNFAVVAAALPIHDFEVEPANLACDGLASLAHRIDLPLPQASVTLGHSRCERAAERRASLGIRDPCAGLREIDCSRPCDFAGYANICS